MGEGRIAHLEKTLVQGQDGYSQGCKTQEDNKCVPVEPNPNQCNLQWFYLLRSPSHQQWIYPDLDIFCCDGSHIWYDPHLPSRSSNVSFLTSLILSLLHIKLWQEKATPCSFMWQLTISFLVLQINLQRDKPVYFQQVAVFLWQTLCHIFTEASNSSYPTLDSQKVQLCGW